MKEGKKVARRKNTSMFVFIFLLILLVIALGYLTGFFGKITGYLNKNVGLNITVGAPQIIEVFNGTASLSLNQGPLYTNKSINFTAYTALGAIYLNDSTAKINVTLVGGVNEVTRNHTACTRANASASGSNYASYNCTVQMWWFDGSGNWNISAIIFDNSSNQAYNSSTTFAIGSTTGFEIAPTNLTWAALGPGATNQTATNDPFNLSNTGNQAIGNATGTSNISINSTNLVGETNGAFAIYASNFTVSVLTGGACSGATCSECGNSSGAHLNRGLNVTINNATLAKGNYTMPDATTGKEELFFCLRIAGSDLVTQAYSTKTEGVWTVAI